MPIRVNYKDVQQQQQQQEEHADDRQPQSRHSRSITSTFSEPFAEVTERSPVVQLQQQKVLTHDRPLL